MIIVSTQRNHSYLSLLLVDPDAYFAYSTIPTANVAIEFTDVVIYLWPCHVPRAHSARVRMAYHLLCLGEPIGARRFGILS